MGDAFMGDIRDFGETLSKPLCCALCGEPLPISGASVLTCRMCGQGHRSLSPPRGGENARFQLGDRVAVLWGEHWWTAHVVDVVSENTRKVHYEGWAPAFDAVVETRNMRAIDYEPRSSIIPPFDESVGTEKRSDMRAAGIVAFAFAIAGIALIFWIKGGESSGPVVAPESNPSAVEGANIGGIFDRTPGEALGTDVSVQRGEKYYVKWGEGWYRGKVLEVVGPNEFLVQYDGWSVDHNELVTKDRLRSLK